VCGIDPEFFHPSEFYHKWATTAPINIDLGLISPTCLRAAFIMPVAPKSVRIQSSRQYLFTLLGSTGTKAARKMLMKLTLGDGECCIISHDFRRCFIKKPSHDFRSLQNL